MWWDVKKMHDFYQSPNGQMIQTLLSHHLNERWPSVHGLTLGAYGYPLPYLSTFLQEATQLMVMMPAPMGATPWPREKEDVKVVLCEENKLPLQDKSLDRLLVLHALESTENTRMLLREAWRVLKEEGQIMVVAPNRRGLWCRSTNSPFGFGLPYTGRQLFTLLHTNLFTPEKPTYALFTPPLKDPLPYRFYQQWEIWGLRWFRKLGGLVIIKAQKQLMAGITEPKKQWVKRIFVPAENEI